MDKYIYDKLIEDCELSAMEIAAMSKKKILDMILSYEGIIGYTDSIIDTIEKIWNIEL